MACFTHHRKSDKTGTRSQSTILVALSHSYQPCHNYTSLPIHCPQVLSTRARKDVALADIKVQVCVFAFDCLYVNGRSLLQAPLTERREALYSSLQVGHRGRGGGWLRCG